MRGALREGRPYSIVFVAAKKVVDTGLRRHDGVGSSGGSIFTAVGIMLLNGPAFEPKAWRLAELCEDLRAYI